MVLLPSDNLTKKQSKVWIMFYAKPRKRYELQKLFRYKVIYDISQKLLKEGYLIKDKNGVCTAVPEPVIREIKELLRKVNEKLTLEEEKILYDIIDSKEMREITRILIEKADIWQDKEENWMKGFTYLFVALSTSIYYVLRILNADYENIRNKILKEKPTLETFFEDEWKKVEDLLPIPLNSKEVNSTDLLKKMAQIPEPLMGKLMKIREKELDALQTSFFAGRRLSK